MTDIARRATRITLFWITLKSKVKRCISLANSLAAASSESARCKSSHASARLGPVWGKQVTGQQRLENPYRNSDVASESAQNTLAAGCDWLLQRAERRLIGWERSTTVNDDGQQQYSSPNEIIHTVEITTTGLEIWHATPCGDKTITLTKCHEKRDLFSIIFGRLRFRMSVAQPQKYETYISTNCIYCCWLGVSHAMSQSIYVENWRSYS